MYAKPLTGAKLFAENIKKCPYSPRFTVLMFFRNVELPAVWDSPGRC